MDDKDQQKPTKSYGKHSTRYWVTLYVVLAIIVYGIIYLAFLHKGSSNSGGGSGLGY